MNIFNKRLKINEKNDFKPYINIPYISLPFFSLAGKHFKDVHFK